MKNIKLSGLLLLLSALALASCQDSTMITSDQATETMPFSLEGELGAGLQFNEDNGHYYNAVEAEGLNWVGAWRTAANTNSGQCVSYLATITSQDENDFIISNFPEASEKGYWLGGIQLFPRGEEPNEGWRWITGEDWDYTNWANGEPNNLGGEDLLHFFAPEFGQNFELGVWNDAGNAPSDAIRGYVVEYECPSGKVVEKVSGSGHFDTGEPGEEALRTFSFNARKYENGVVAGEYQFKNRNQEVTEHGDITCLSVSEDGSQAWLGGIIERNDPIENIYGYEIAFRVEDNGQGGNADPDRMSGRTTVAPGYSALTCKDQLPVGGSLNDIEKGNITIH